MAGPLLEVTGLSKRFGGFVALDGIDLTVAHCWSVATRMAPISGPAQDVVPPIIGMAIELTA